MRRETINSYIKTTGRNCGHTRKTEAGPGKSEGVISNQEVGRAQILEDFPSQSGGFDLRLQFTGKQVRAATEGGMEILL